MSDNVKVNAIPAASPEERRALRKQAQRGGAGDAAEPDPRQVHDFGGELAQVPVALGTAPLTPLDGQSGPTLEVVVDPDAAAHGEALLSATRFMTDGLPPQVQAARTRLEGNLGRYAAVEACQIAGESVLERITATERWAAAGERACNVSFYRTAERLLSDTTLTKEQRARLRVALGPALKERASEVAARSAEADKTRAASAEAAAIVAEAQREVHMMETADDLQADRDVSEADLRTAIDTLHALGSGAQ